MNKIYSIILLFNCTVLAVDKPLVKFEQCYESIKSQKDPYVLNVKLTQAQIVGNPPVLKEGAIVNKAVNLEKRFFTRLYLELRGTNAGVLVGEGAKSLITFDLKMNDLKPKRDRNNKVISFSNIPNLIIGNQYLIIKSSESSANLLNDCIFEKDSIAARSLINKLQTQ